MLVEHDKLTRSNRAHKQLQRRIRLVHQHTTPDNRVEPVCFTRKGFEIPFGKRNVGQSKITRPFARQGQWAGIVVDSHDLATFSHQRTRQ